jgi:predicted DNA-binding transcriptional regulator AlpA
MESFSTRQAAKMLGISSSTLARYIAAGKVPTPKVIHIGEMKVHLWTSRKIERVRKLLPRIEDGRTTRRQKQERESTKPS